MQPPPEVTRRTAPAAETVQANRRWWDGAAGDYYAEHGTFLGDVDFVWGPEGLRESQAGLLGEVGGRRILEVGAGAAQCSRWLVTRGATVVATDLSAAMLSTAARIARRHPEVPSLPLAQCDARALPFADASFEIVFTAYGVLPFVADPEVVLAECARVLRDGGRLVFSTTHPVRWAFPDDPGPGGLTAGQSYFDRTPYVEQDPSGTASYVEHHRTLGDRVREIHGAGLTLVDLVEPEWPAGLEQEWGGWSPLRGRLLPGTAIFVCEKGMVSP
ncbi:class I SAM-dependent methyltransferase [Intrasporangium sp.]|uniref:class I SAM-dependent methyltransferase n=1 Tax=Intrasporangium sp. TaxID=1925024 RepID=UPI003221A6A4